MGSSTLGEFQLQCWERDEFEDLRKGEEPEEALADRAWKVPDEAGMIDPNRKWRCDDLREAAEKFAAYCHSRRDGWEWSWPKEFVVFDGKQYHLIEVERETVPEFNASKPKVIEVVLPGHVPDVDVEDAEAIGGEA